MPGPVPPPPPILSSPSAILRPIGVFLASALKFDGQTPHTLDELHRAAGTVLGARVPVFKDFVEAVVCKDSADFTASWIGEHVLRTMSDLGYLLSTGNVDNSWLRQLIWAATVEKVVNAEMSVISDQLAARYRKIREAADFLGLPAETPSHNALDIMVAQLGLLTGRKPPAPGWIFDDEREWTECYAAWREGFYIEEFLVIGHYTDADNRVDGWHLDLVAIDNRPSVTVLQNDNPLAVIAAIGRTVDAAGLKSWGTNGNLTYLVCQASQARHQALLGDEDMVRKHMAWFSGDRELTPVDPADPVSVAVHAIVDAVDSDDAQRVVDALNAVHALVAPAEAQAKVAS